MIHWGFGMAGAIIIVVALFTGANYYIINRCIAIFGGEISSRLSILLIALLITLVAVGMQTAMFLDIKFFSILWSIGSRLFILIPLVAILMGIIQLFQVILPENYRKIWWIIAFALLFLYLFWFWTYNTLSTKLTEVDIEVDGLWKPINLLYVADLHVDDILSTVHLSRLKQEIELQKPDLVLFGGDFFNRANIRQAEYFKILSSITVPMYGVGWNHDWIWDDEAMNTVSKITNIIFLDRIDIQQGIVIPELWIQLIWVIDKSRRKWQTIQNLLSPYTFHSALFSILLTHQPIALEKLKDFPIDLELAGHTHRGQIIWPRELVWFFNDYAYGLYSEWDRNAFVTQGIGTWWLPLRIGTRSEIVIIHLLPKK